MASGLILLAALIGFLVCAIGAVRGNPMNRPAALTGAGLFLIAASIAAK